MESLGLVLQLTLPLSYAFSLTRIVMLFLCTQQRLLLSILPKHIADEMLQDMKKEASQKEMQQFNTMYMYRHENVRWVL